MVPLQQALAVFVLLVSAQRCQARRGGFGRGFGGVRRAGRFNGNEDEGFEDDDYEEGNNGAFCTFHMEHGNVKGSCSLWNMSCMLEGQCSPFLQRVQP